MSKSLVSIFALAACTLSISYCSGSKNGGGKVAVTSVILNKSSTAVCVGGSAEQLFATVLPSTATNKNVTWSTSASEIATVGTDGTVTAVSAGNAAITVKTADGNFTATCDVAVSATCISVTSVSLNKTAATVAVGGSEQLSATITPSNATNQNVTWSTSDSSVATVSAAGLVVGVKAGNATITVTTVDGSFTDACAVTVKTVTAGTISGTITGWSTFLSSQQPPLSTADVQIVIRKKADSSIVQTVSDKYTVGNDGSFTLSPNANPSGGYLYPIDSVDWNGAGVTVSPTSGVNLLQGPNSNYEAKIAILDASDNRLGWLQVSPLSSSEGDVSFWYTDKTCSINGTIDKAVTGDEYSLTFSNITFPVGWSFLIFTVTGADTETASVATSGDSWYCSRYTD